MTVLGVDLGGTKLAAGLFTGTGDLVSGKTVPLGNRSGKAVSGLISELIEKMLRTQTVFPNPPSAIGIAVPGIRQASTGTVWAPNIPGWEDFPLAEEVKAASGSIPLLMDSDRACSILGEQWQGNAKGCENAVFLAVGTGIGAGILAGGQILRGAMDIAGAAGWMALDQPFAGKYTRCGCLEYHASGEGIARITLEFLLRESLYQGELKSLPAEKITAKEVFTACKNKDPLGRKVMAHCIRYWGMAAANIVSLLNPEKIIFGGGVFGPALEFLPAIREEAEKWAQPVSIRNTRFEGSALGTDAVLYGAAYLALKNISDD